MWRSEPSSSSPICPSAAVVGGALLGHLLLAPFSQKGAFSGWVLVRWLHVTTTPEACRWLASPTMCCLASLSCSPSPCSGNPRQSMHLESKWTSNQCPDASFLLHSPCRHMQYMVLRVPGLHSDSELVRMPMEEVRKKLCASLAWPTLPPVSTILWERGRKTAGRG